LDDYPGPGTHGGIISPELFMLYLVGLLFVEEYAILAVMTCGIRKRSNDYWYLEETQQRLRQKSPS